MNAKRTFCFLYFKELSKEISTIPLHDSNLPSPTLDGYQNNKPHKRTRKNVWIPVISLHIKQTQLHHTTPICRGTTPPKATYNFSALSLAAVSMQFLAHLRLAK